MTSKTIVKLMNQKVKRNLKSIQGKIPNTLHFEEQYQLLLVSHRKQWKSEDSGIKLLPW